MSSRPGYRQIIGLQLGITVLVAGAWGGLKDANAAASALVGGLVCTIPAALFALRLAAAARRGSDAFGQSFLVGELVKIGLTGALFVLVFRWFPAVEALPMMVGFIAALHGYLFALVVARK